MDCVSLVFDHPATRKMIVGRKIFEVDGMLNEGGESHAITGAETIAAMGGVDGEVSVG